MIKSSKGKNWSGKQKARGKSKGGENSFGEDPKQNRRKWKNQKNELEKRQRF